MSPAKNITKNVSKDLSWKYDHAKISATDTIETVILKTAEGTGDLIGDKIANKITINSAQNNSETFLEIEKKRERKTKREICISRKKTVDYW